MEPTINFITLGVPDLEAARRFYVDGLGWEPTLEVEGEVVFIQVSRGQLLGLWGGRQAGGRRRPGGRGGGTQAGGRRRRGRRAAAGGVPRRGHGPLPQRGQRGGSRAGARGGIGR